MIIIIIIIITTLGHLTLADRSVLLIFDYLIW